MSNLGYILAAYGITLGALAMYGLHLWIRVRPLEREVTSLIPGERERYGQQ